MQVYKSDITDLKNELEVARRNLDREKIRGSELEAKLGSLEHDLKFKPFGNFSLNHTLIYNLYNKFIHTHINIFMESFDLLPNYYCHFPCRKMLLF